VEQFTQISNVVTTRKNIAHNNNSGICGNADQGNAKTKKSKEDNVCLPNIKKCGSSNKNNDNETSQSETGNNSRNKDDNKEEIRPGIIYLPFVYIAELLRPSNLSYTHIQNVISFKAGTIVPTHTLVINM
jgi:hypothetical protein